MELLSHQCQYQLRAVCAHIITLLISHPALDRRLPHRCCVRERLSKLSMRRKQASIDYMKIYQTRGVNHRKLMFAALVAILICCLKGLTLREVQKNMVRFVNHTRDIHN